MPRMLDPVWSWSERIMLICAPALLVLGVWFCLQASHTTSCRPGTGMRQNVECHGPSFETAICTAAREFRCVDGDWSEVEPIPRYGMPVELLP